MSLFKWDDSYSVSIKEMDDQHQKWFDLLNNTHEAIVSKQSSSDLEPIINELVSFTEFHLRTEEELLENAKYKDFKDHKKSHDEFEKKVWQFHERYKACDHEYLATHLARFLLEWVAKHIKEEDKKYGQFLNGKGIH